MPAAAALRGRKVRSFGAGALARQFLHYPGAACRAGEALMSTGMKIGAGMRRLAAAVVAAIILAVASLAAVWLLLLGLWPPPPQLVNKSGFSQAIYDRNGRLLRLTLSSDEKYRLWTPLK